MRVFICFFCTIFLLSGCKTREMKPIDEAVNIVPKPLFLKENDGSFVLNKNTLIKYSSVELFAEANYLAQKIRKSTGYKLKVISGDVVSENEIFLNLGINKNIDEEAYSMNVTPKHVIINAGNAQGVFYGIQTLFQLLPPEVESLKKVKHVHWNIPCVSIEDAPRFKWRGVLMDICRNFMPADFIKKQIDVLAMYKINTLHLHLTDDQGWRVEVKQYPKLTEIGSKRIEFDGKEHSGFLTQEEIVDIVEYAKSRYITIIPELELPGHAMAALASYPELACNEKDFVVRNIHGVERDVFCAGKEEVFIFWENVLAEIIPLFPGDFIHIGGDECPKDRWLECPNCTKRIENNNLKDVHELQSYFIRRIEKIVNNYGKKIIGWDEILEDGINPTAAVMSWRGEKGGIKAANAGHNVIMTPNNYLYIDYYQADKKIEPASIGRLNTLERVYSYNPIPKTLTEDKHQYILGAQANVWGEYLYSPELFEYRAYPRVLALAEVVWTSVENKNYDSFERRLYNQLVRLDYHKINYHIPQPEQPGGSCNTVVFTDSVELAFKTVRPEKMVYTLNGKTPNMHSLEYIKPIKVKESTILKIRTILPSGRMSPVRTITVQKQEYSSSIKRSNLKQGLSGKLAKGRFVHVNDLDNVVNWDTIQISSLKDIYRVQVNKPFGEEAFFAVVLAGYIDISEDAVYYFSTIADQFWIDDKLLINNENEVKRYARTDSSVALEKGLHPIKIVYISNVTGGWPNVWSGLNIEYREAENSKFTSIEDTMLFYQNHIK